ncbi:zeta toxin family protein [Stenotrophomonas sp. SORGH_AS_0321]|uniref:zeta toxin family protein n=1 Tax=Stenotrophomonas sp. SORGH_AS_0321 TaxID=3041787 RepID=UPI00286C4ADA|nr:zeta toxin family protein [Stenotrophomonas sp. SORGH_AS_0321]
MLDTTLGNGDSAVTLIKDLQAKGYQVEIRGVVAHDLKSELGVDRRFSRSLDAMAMVVTSPKKYALMSMERSLGRGSVQPVSGECQVTGRRRRYGTAVQPLPPPTGSATIHFLSRMVVEQAQTTADTLRYATRLKGLDHAPAPSSSTSQAP